MSDVDVWKKLSKLEVLFRLTYMEFEELKEMLAKRRPQTPRRPRPKQNE